MDISFISYNVNGIRAALKKGFIDWLRTNPADIICLQELKAHECDIDRTPFEELGYRPYFYCASKKGYSGVGILSRLEPHKMVFGHGYEQSDLEGRVLRADFGDLTVLSVYFPSGTTGEERQTYKYQWLEDFLEYVTELKKERSRLIVCGDYNIAHKEIDLFNPKGNKKTSGFLPEERAWFDRFLSSGFVDTFRHLNKEPHQYSWWSVLRPSVRLNNRGWRIDYITVSDALQSHISEVAILPNVNHSDHCPVYLKLSV